MTYQELRAKLGAGVQEARARAPEPEGARPSSARAPSATMELRTATAKPPIRINSAEHFAGDCLEPAIGEHRFLLARRVGRIYRTDAAGVLDVDKHPVLGPIDAGN